MNGWVSHSFAPTPGLRHERDAKVNNGFVSNSERRKHAARRAAAVEGVAAYLADEDAMAAAWSLTVLAAAAVTALAEATGRTPDEALGSLDHAGADASRRQRPPR